MSTLFEDRQATLTAFMAETFPEPVAPSTNNAAPPSHLTDARVLDAARAAKGGPVFDLLLAGELIGYPSASEAVAGLLFRLAFWTQKDAAQMRRIFEGSGLHPLWADKWDRLGASEIAKAIEAVTETYSPPVPVFKRDVGVASSATGAPGASVGQEMASPATLSDRIESGAAWARRAPESVPRIIPGILPWQGITMMSAHSETGKTWLLIAMLLSVANDRPFLGQYPIERPGRCLYIGSEGSHAGARNRFYGLARGMGLDPDEALANIDFLWRDGTLIDNPAFLAEMTELAPGYALIGCDIVSDLWTGRENEAADVIPLLRGLRPIANAGPTIVLVHHWGKDGDSTSGRDEGQRSRGSGAWKANTDSGIYLTRKKGAGRTTVTCTSSDDVPAASFTFNWPAQLVDGSEGIDLDWKTDESGLTTMQLVQRQAEALIRSERGLSAHQIAERIHANKTTLSIALKGLEGSGLVEVRATPYLDAAGHSRLRPGYFITDDSLCSDTMNNGAEQSDLGGL